MKTPTLSKEAEKQWEAAVSRCARESSNGIFVHKYLRDLFIKQEMEIQSAILAERERAIEVIKEWGKMLNGGANEWLVDDVIEALTETTHKPPYGTPSTISEIVSTIVLLAHSNGVKNEGLVNVDFYVEQIEKGVSKQLMKQRIQYVDLVEKAIKHGTIRDPNPYGNTVTVKRHNQVVAEMEYILLNGKVVKK